VCPMMDDREERVDYAGINADEPAATGASLDEVEISFPTLAGRSQVTPLPVPLQNPALLPLMTSTQRYLSDWSPKLSADRTTAVSSSTAGGDRSSMVLMSLSARRRGRVLCTR